MTALPHLFVLVDMEVEGVGIRGISSEGLPPKWFTKDPTTTFEEDLPAMRAVITHAAETAAGSEYASYFDFWRDLYEGQKKWAESEGHPPLLANLGVSLIERAVIDAMARRLGESFGTLLRSNVFGIRAGEIDSDLGECSPGDLLPSAPLRDVAARHTIGLGDPLSEEDIDDPLEDGLPHSLEESIRAYGLRYFKIKICGDLETDRGRLARIREILERETGGDYRTTFDGNEQFANMNSFREHWDVYRNDPAIAPLLDHILFVEQPIHRDHALADSVRDELEAWSDAPRFIIDESEADLSSLPRALSLGYTGTSHKNCKGIVKGVLNAMRLERLRRESPGTEWILSGEDLANVGPVALLQDLAVMTSLGIAHVERNGHHYFQGLSAFPESLQREVLQCHSDLYRRHDRGFPAVKIEEGRIEMGSIVDAPFGVAVDPLHFSEIGSIDGSVG